jgi:REP element-mobilizing transposase RayT
LKVGGVVWAYCRMPNHVHLILKPGHADDLGTLTTWAARSARLAGAPRTSPTPANAGRDTCSRAALLRSRRTTSASSAPFDV